MPSPRRRLTRLLALTSVLLCTNATAEGLGLRVGAGDELWPRWQARLLTSTSFSLWRHAALGGADLGQRRQQSLSLLGDYYFSPLSFGGHEISGLRATSGLIIGSLGSRALLSNFGDPSRVYGLAGSRAGHMPHADARWQLARFESAPYLGIGYSNSPAKTGWGFSADVGIAARNSSAARVDRVFLGSQSLDDLLREMRLTPLLNVGVSYSF